MPLKLKNDFQAVLLLSCLLYVGMLLPVITKIWGPGDRTFDCDIFVLLGTSFFKNNNKDWNKGRNFPVEGSKAGLA